jgi:hypothetical protein
MQRLTSPIVAAIVIIAMLALAGGGMYVIATRSGSEITSGPSHRVATAATQPLPVVNLDELSVRGQPMRWSQAERAAVQNRAAGKFFDRDDYKAAMRAARYNQKNGWTDDGTERTEPGTPLRNNQKRAGNSGNSQDNDSGSCLQSFTLTTAVCGDGGEDITGGDGDGVPDLGGIDLEELGVVENHA